MEIIQTLKEMQDRAMATKRAGKVIGFVPTMGFLHEGHLSLIRLARAQCDLLVVSLFVNPTQFGPHEDLDAYPRDFLRDESLCKNAGVDLVFYPTPERMYASDSSVWVNEEQLSMGLCGAARAGHFQGVCTVVAKLFNLVQPDLAVFGEKDAQQVRVVERMVRDLNFPVKIIRGAIVREPDGLAMSSRNKFLSITQRQQALCLQSALGLVRERVAVGERCVAVLRSEMVQLIEAVPLAKVDYIEFVDDVSLCAVDQVAGDTLVALAVKFESIRLIDNEILVL